MVDETGRSVSRLCLNPTERQAFASVGFLEQGQWAWSLNNLDIEDDDTFDRQVLAFGPDFLNVLRRLRITVVGAGATGSATVQLLMRLGAHYVASIDPEFIERSNTTRIHGSRKKDAVSGEVKVDVVRRTVEESGFDVNLITIEAFVTDRAVRDVLKSSDLIFSCTDDHEGRLFLNRFAMFYNTPVIDMGIKIDPARLRDNRIRLADGCVTVVAPGVPCLVCRKIVDPIKGREENLKRTNPDEYGKRLAEGYIATEQVSAPSVITLTTAVACMAVDELTARLTGYRQPGNHWLHKFVSKKDFAPGSSTSECGVCGNESWGRGDMEPFLDRVE